MTRPKALAETASESDRASRTKWWGQFEIPLGHTGRWRIGPLALEATRLRNEWRVTRATLGEQTDTHCSFERDGPAAETAPGAVLTRYAAAGTSGALELRPMLPDRSVVTKPEHPISILPRQKLTIFVGSPLWVALLAEEPLGELPLQPPKLTWWGTNTREGELCYASRTQGRLRVEEVALYPHRVLTAVLVQNDSDQPLSFDSLNIPVRRLGVFAAKNGRLWTESVTFERAQGEQFAVLNIGDAPPDVAANAESVSEPRDADRERSLFRAFGSLFG
jgi:hypothetical protein